MGLTVLLTNNTLFHYAGTELYVRDVAFGLRRRGHSPVAYSPVHGPVAEVLRNATIPVIDDLAAMGVQPDIIHGHHHLETMTAALHFPGVPTISFCHGWTPWEEVPAYFPSVRRYVAVDRVCLDRLRFQQGIAESKIKLLYNFVDLQRFQIGPALPDRPTRALVFSNSASEQTFVVAVREACKKRGIEVDVGGEKTQVIERPEEVLSSYDVVFAKARAAMEAMAMGRAVVLCDSAGAGPLVRSENFAALRELNFGVRTLDRPITAEVIGGELDRYDARDAAHVRDAMREQGDLERRLDELEVLYREVIAERFEPMSLLEMGRAAAAYLKWISPCLKGNDARFKDAVTRIAELEQREREGIDERQRAERIITELLKANTGLAEQLASQAARRQDVE